MQLPVLHPLADTIGTPEAREKCGVFAVWGDPHPARTTYFGLFALQHRGQESAGIATTDGNQIERHVDMGLVSSVFSPETLSRLDAHAHNREKRPGGAIGHNRYSTTGASMRANAQPLMTYFKGGPVAIGHNGNVVNAAAIRRRLEDDGHAFATTSDTEVILQLMAAHAQGSLFSPEDPLAAALRELKGAFSLVFLFRDRIEVARDPWGWRPLVLGRTPDGHPVAASESVALSVIGAEVVREVEPGEIVTFSDNGVSSRRFSDPMPRRAHCIFEHVYFASPASHVFGRSVQTIRERLGARLAQEAPVPHADLVMAMPDSGRSAATGFAREAHLPYREGIIPNRYVGRTFIKPTNEERAMAVRLKLNVIDEVVRGNKVVIVDDSIVRGTTTRIKMDALREAGAKEIHLRISSPPIKHPCFFGVDFPESSQLVANGREVEEIRRLLGVDSLHYLSLDGLLEVCTDDKLTAEHYCTACYTGNYPVDIPEGLSKDAMSKC